MRFRTGLAAVPWPAAERRLQRTAARDDVAGRRTAEGLAEIGRDRFCRAGRRRRSRLILFHRVGDEEVVDAFDARTGAPGWHFAYRTTYRDDFGFDEGPRAVPVVARNRVYTFGAEGQLHAIDLATGKGVWSVDTAQRFHVRKGFFGAAGSPLVEDGRVIANIGGATPTTRGIVAFNADTGAVLWTATNHEASYSSPVGATFGGKRAVVFFTRQGLVALDPGDRRRAVPENVAIADRCRPSTPRRRSSSAI